MNKRRWYKKKRFFVPAALVLLLVATLVAWIGPAIWQPMGRPGKYAAAMQATIEALQPPGENAWPHIQHMIDLAEPIKDKHESAFADAVPGSNGLDLIGEDPPADAHQAALNREHTLRLLADLQQVGVWDALERAARCPRSVRAVSAEDWFFRQTNYEVGKLRYLARANARRMREAIDKNDQALFAAATDQGLALGRCAAPHTGLLHELVALAMQDLVRAEVTRALMHKQLSANTLRALMNSFERHRLMPAERMLDTELYAVLDTLEYLHTDDGRGSGYFNFDASSAFSHDGAHDQSKPNRWIAAAGVVLPRKHQARARAEQHIKQLTDSVARADPARVTLDLGLALEAGYKDEMHMAAGILLPSLTTATRQRARVDTLRNGLIVMLALELHHRTSGAYPPSLDALAPSLLASVPPDRFNARPFHYKLLDASATTPGAGYLLYSFGLDDTDNGGTPHEKPYKSFHEDGQGTDFIINR